MAEMLVRETHKHAIRCKFPPLRAIDNTRGIQKLRLESSEGKELRLTTAAGLTRAIESFQGILPPPVLRTLKESAVNPLEALLAQFEELGGSDEPLVRVFHSVV